MATNPATIIDEPAAPVVVDPVVPPVDPAAVVVDPPVIDPVTPPVDPAAKPSDDWRTDMATDNGVVDEKLLGWLGRFQSKASAMAAVKKQRDDISAGKYIKPLSDDASDEEKAAYRGLFGIPDKPEGYLEKLPDGLVVGDDDRPAVDKFVEAMHAQNAPKPVVAAALQTYYDIVDEQLAEQQEVVEQAKQGAIEDLRSEWGPDYKRNLNVMTAFRQSLPEEVNAVFEHGLMPDGTPIGYNPGVLKWLTAQALEKNPLATVVPGAGADQADAIANEIEQIETEMGNRSSSYWKGEKDASGNTVKQRRLLTLYEARDRLK